MGKIKEYDLFQDFYNEICDKECKIDDYIEKFKKYAISKNKYIREDVASLLINFDCDFARDLLHKLASDKSWLVRYDAYDSLGVIGKKDSLLYLYPLLEKESNKTNILILLFTLTDIYLYNSYDYSEYLSILFKLKYKYGKDEKLLPAIVAQFVLLGKLEYYDELISLYKIDSNILKYSVLCVLNNLLIEKKFLDSTIRDKIFEDVSKIKDVDNKKFPRIKTMIKDILNKRN